MSELARDYAEKPTRRIKTGFLNFLNRLGHGVELAGYEASGLSENIIEELESHWPEQPQPMVAEDSSKRLVRAAASIKIKLP